MPPRQKSAAQRAQNSGLLPLLRLDTWNELDGIGYDRALLSDLTSLRFVEAATNGPRAHSHVSLAPLRVEQLAKALAGPSRGRRQA